MAGYDPSAANEYNQLIQQGLDPEEAAQMAGIDPADLGNYSEVNGQLTQNDGPPVDNTNAGPQTDYGTTYDAFGAKVPAGPPTYATEVNPYDPGTTFDVPATTPPVQEAAVNPANNPTQFPAYDDEGNLLPGYAVNPETGGTYYAGFNKTTGNVTTTSASNSSLGTTPPTTATPTPPTTSTTANVTTRSLGTAPPAAATPTPPTQQSNVNDPYYGLTPQQITALGNADPTDPYIRARLGIPQLSNSPLASTPGFGNIKTGVPLLDSALGLLGGLFSVTGPATTKAAVPAQAATTGASTPPITITALGPPTEGSAVPSPTDYGTTYDEFGTVIPAGPPTQATEVNPYDPGTTFATPTATANTSNSTTLTADQTNAFYNGTGTLTAYQQAEINQQTAADAAKLYQGSNNEALREIDASSAAIAKNEVGIAYAQNVIAENNAELADPNISDARRAELEASNARQQDYIQTATENTLINQNVIEQNAAVYAAGGGNPGDGQTPTEVNASQDPTIQVANNTASVPLTDSGLTILSEEETNALFAGVDTNLVTGLAPVTNNPVDLVIDDTVTIPSTNSPELLTNDQTDTLYPVVEEPLVELQDNNLVTVEDPALSQPLTLDLPLTTNTVTTTEINDAESEIIIPEFAPEVQDPFADPELPQAIEDPLVQSNTALVVNSENDPELSAPVIDEGIPTLTPSDVDPFADEELPQPQNEEIVDWYGANDVNPNQDADLITALDDETVDSLFPEDVNPLTDEEIAAQDAALQDQFLNELVAEQSPEPVDPTSDEELQQQLQDQIDQGSATTDWYDAGDVDPNEDTGLGLPPGAEPDDPPTSEPFALNPDEDPGVPQPGGENPATGLFGGAGPGDSEAATKLSAKNQATLQARYKQPSTTDWRVRLVLAQNSDYLYNALESEGGAGILAPLKAENGVIFPYTPNITMNYQANYDQYDLTHSNYRGIFYKNSRAGDIQLRCTFTAQDTNEANYLLAVIHFFRSVTKMFYGQDSQRGTPPPLVYLLGLGDYQFSGHPCVVSTFNYNLPNEVDYIRAVAPNNYGTNLLNRRTPVQSAPGGTNFSGAIRLANALLSKGAVPQIPGIGSVVNGVNNTARATYVPTKMEIDITLIPVQTRSQVSKQFSLKDFANGHLIKGGFW